MGYNINFIYSDNKDRELLINTPSKFPVFINFLNICSSKDKKEAFRIKARWGAKKDPFVEIIDEFGKVDKCFYSENISAIGQLIEWLNNDSKN